MPASLRIKHIAFSDFRNYERFDLDDIGELTVFIGRNAIGKTNILEGIQLLTSAQSFRHPQVIHLIREGASASRITMDATDGNRLITTALALEPGKKRFTVNGKSKASVDVRGVLPSIMFTPDDLELAKKSSSVKRDALDALGTQLNRNYYIVRRDYEKTIRYKNRLLKDEASPLLIDSINESLITCGAQLLCLRRALFERVMPHVKKNYASIARDGEDFSATYIPSWMKISGITEEIEPLTRDEARETIAHEIGNYVEEERRRHRALVGPHNDQIMFTLAGRDASTFASQGQQRSIVLAWKLAEVAVTREVLGTSPVLLLDDVFSELDESRRAMLMGFVTEEVQTFITATDVDGFDERLLSRARVVKLEEGCHA